MDFYPQRISIRNGFLFAKKNKPMWKPQQLVDRNGFSLWHIMSNRKHAMWNKKHARWNTKHVICKHMPYFEKWPNVSWMEPWLRNLTEPNVSWMEPSLRNHTEPNVSWMDPWLRNHTEPNVSWMEPWLRNLSEPNVSWMEPSLRNLSEPNVSWTEPSLRNLSKPNVSWMEPSLRNLSEPNVSWMEPSLRNRFHSFGTSRNLVQGFGRLPQTTPKLYSKNPKPFRLLGKKTPTLNSAPPQPPTASLRFAASLRLGGTVLQEGQKCQLCGRLPLAPRKALGVLIPFAKKGGDKTGIVFLDPKKHIFYQDPF